MPIRRRVVAVIGSGDRGSPAKRTMRALLLGGRFCRRRHRHRLDDPHTSRMLHPLARGTLLGNRRRKRCTTSWATPSRSVGAGLIEALVRTVGRRRGSDRSGTGESAGTGKRLSWKGFLHHIRQLASKVELSSSSSLGMMAIFDSVLRLLAGWRERRCSPSTNGGGCDRDS